MTFTLVNPQIDNQYKADNNNSLEAAQNIWDKLSKHTKQYVPESFFSLQKGGKLFHFKVEETLNNDDVSYKISSYNYDKNDKNFINFLKKQSGGKKKKKKKYFDTSSSSDSSDSSDTSDTSDTTINTDNLVYRFKTKDRVLYSKYKPSIITYYDIYDTDYLLPTYYSNIEVKFKPLDTILLF
jgi:hypothetical protein